MAAGVDSYDHLVGGLCDESPDAVLGLLEAFGRRLYDYLSLTLGDRDVATHALADTIIVATGHIGRLREADHLPVWLLALARRERERQQRAAAARVIPDTLGAVTAPAGASPAEMAYLAMARLTPLEREVLVLSVTHPLLFATDAARVLGIEDDAAVELHGRAVQRFREGATLLGLGPDLPLTELLETVPQHLLGAVPHDRLLYMCVSVDMANRRPRVRERGGVFGDDGFPLIDTTPAGAADEDARRGGRALGWMKAWGLT
jgi:DNA-directed RNA polymerase specialized sigma24 family protein